MKVQTAKEYREKYGWDMPSLKLARIMFKDNELLFKNVEEARTYLRGIEGKSWISKGAVSKKALKPPDRPRNPFKLPESDASQYEPFVIPESKILIMSDIHIPFHDVEALSAILGAVSEKDGIEAVLLNGDILDFYSLSRFAKDPKKRSVAGELNMLQDMYEVFSKHFKCKFYYKYGNHEERYDHFLYMKAAELADVPEFNLDRVIQGRLSGVEIIKDKRIIQFGNLSIIHGHEYQSGVFQSVNVARGLFLKSKVSAMQGHSHQVSEHTETDMKGKITTTWSTGCLCNLHPEYAKLNRWSQGFAIASRVGDDFWVKNYRIHQGKVL
jgi:predicted phosphodiesterase